MKRKFNFSGEIDRFTVLTVCIVALVLGGAFAYKYFAPQSALRSRLGGEAIELKLPKDADITRPISLGKTRDTKWVSYYDKDGNVKLKEFSDYGLLEGEYILRIK